MEIAVPCTTCKSKTPCDCKIAIVSFFKLLEKAHNRILTEKVTSDALVLPEYKAGIDKLNAYFAEPIAKLEVINLAKAHNIQYETVRLKNKQHLKLSRQNHVLHLPLNSSREDVLGFISNPNQFENWIAYLNFLQSSLPTKALQEANIHRIDLNIDFSMHFSELIQKIDVKNKSTSTTFDEKAGIRTGLYIGKNPELIVIYDKSKKMGLAEDISRVELRLIGKKLPCRSVFEIPNYLISNEYFGSLQGYDLTFVDTHLNEKQKAKLQEFKTILKRDGLYSARKSMNRTHNFDRDFEKMLKTHKWSTQFSEAYKKGIKRFFA